MITPDDVYEWLSDVKDPEIPVLSLVDMGIVRDVNITGTSVTVTITPTFVGCPALELMKSEIEDALLRNGASEAAVMVSFTRPWSSNDITEKGRRALRNFGLAPPPQHDLIPDLDVLEYAECPRCGSRNTDLRSPFGPTLCRSIHYCRDCRESFEQFKPL